MVALWVFVVDTSWLWVCSVGLGVGFGDGLLVVAVGDGWFGSAWFDFLHLWWICGYGLKI